MQVTPARARVGMVVGAVLFVAFILYLTRAALFPFLLGAGIAYVIAPLVERLAVVQPWYGRRPDVARGAAVLVIYGLVLAGLIVAGILFIPTLVHEVDQLIEAVPDFADDAQAQIDEWVAQYQREVPEDLRRRINEAIQNASSEIGAVAQGVVGRSIGFFFSTVSALLGYLSVPFFVFYALKDRDQAFGRFYAFFPEKLRPDVRECVRIANQVIGAYVRGQLFLGVLIFFITLVGLNLMGIEFALALAFFAGLTELIPIIGPIIGFIPAFIVVLATEPDKWWWVILFYLGVQAAENYLLVPRVHSTSVNIHPAVVLVLLTVGGTLFGLWGVLVAVPVFAAVRDVYAYVYRRLGDAEREAQAEADIPPNPPLSPP